MAIDKEALKAEIIRQISSSINGAVIDDTKPSTNTVYSSSKTNEIYALKTDIPSLENYALKTDIPKKDELVTKDELISDGVTLEFLLGL